MVLSLLLGRLFYFLARFGEETRLPNPIGTRPSIGHQSHHHHHSRSSGKLPNFVSGVLNDPYRPDANDVDDPMQGLQERRTPKYEELQSIAVAESTSAKLTSTYARLCMLI